VEATVVRLVDLEYYVDGKEENEDSDIKIGDMFSGQVHINHSPMLYAWELLPGNFLQLKKNGDTVLETSEIQDKIAIMLGVNLSKNILTNKIPVLMKEALDVELGCDLVEMEDIINKYFPEANFIFSTKSGVYGIQFQGDTGKWYV